MKEIDLKSWDRADQYNLFSNYKSPIYGVTSKIDITNVYNFAKKNNVSFYFSMGYIVQTAMKDIDEYNIRLENGKLILDERNIVSFCCKNKDERNYRFIDVPYCDNILEFCKLAREIDSKQKTLFGNGKYGKNYSMFISCIPWINFTMITNPKTGDTSDFITHIIWDKISEENGRKFINFGLEVNHRIVDGYAIAQLILNITNLIENLK